MTVLLDSWAWLEYFFGSSKGEKIKEIIEKRTEQIVLTKINVFEVYTKIMREAGKEQAEKFVSFMIAKSFVDELGTETLKLAAEEKIKYKLGMADAIIFSTAIKYGATLYTGDPDFEKVKQVVRVVFL